MFLRLVKFRLFSTQSQGLPIKSKLNPPAKALKEPKHLGPKVILISSAKGGFC
jgi:hypothetical protein